MKKLDLGQTINTLANLGVIAGIVFLAVELHQNNELMEAQATRLMMENRAGGLERWAEDPELMSLRLKAVNGEPLKQDEQWRIISDFAALISRWEWDYQQLQSARVEYIPIEAYRDIFSRWPYMRQLWSDQRRKFSPDFVKFIDENVVNER